MMKKKQLVYNNAYVELYEIIKNLTEQEKRKIPEAFIDNLRTKKNDEYIFEYDKTKKIFEQNLMIETKALLVQMYIKYLAPEDETELWNTYSKICENKIEEKKKEKYNPSNLFKNRENVIEKTKVGEVAIIEYKEKNLLQKIFDKIKQLIRKS